MNIYRQPYYPSHEVLSSRDDNRTVSHSRAYSSADSSARLLPTDHSRPKISRSQTCKTALKPKQLKTPDNSDTTFSIAKKENGPPGTPVPIPSLSSSIEISPQSSTHRSPITPTFVDSHPEDKAQGHSPLFKPRSLKQHREVEKRNISYPMSSSTYSTVPLTLDIRVDRDAYEPRREPPRPVGPLPQDLQTSYMEWDESSSKLDKMKKSMRLVGHGHRKQATSVTLDTRSHKSPDRCLNATPRASSHSRHRSVTVDRHPYQERPSHVSNFSRPTFQTSSNVEKRSRHLESNHKQAVLLPMCDWQEFLRSSMPSQETRRPQEPSPVFESVKDRLRDDTLCSQKSALVSRHIANSPPSITGKAYAGTKIVGQQALAELNTGTVSPAKDVHKPNSQAPSFYTYHVTRRIDATKPLTSSYTSPQADNTDLLAQLQQLSNNVQGPLSAHVDDQNGSPKTRTFKTIVQGMAKKSSMSSLRRRGAHSGAQR